MVPQCIVSAIWDTKHQNGSNYDYYFMIKEFDKIFEGQFEFLGENTEKYKTFYANQKNRKGKRQDNNIQNKIHW